MRQKVWMSCLFLSAALPAAAQFSGAIQGTVTDASGALVPGAAVTLTDTGTNAVQSFTTGSSGQYFFNRLAPGTYRVTVEAQGFGQAVREQTVSTEQTAGIDVRLTPGAKTDVTVLTDSGHGINPDETRNQYTLSAREIEEFPLQNRSTLALLRATPGATGINENSQNIPVNRQAAGEAVGGRLNTSNVFVLDNVVIDSELASPDSSSALQSGEAIFIPQPDLIAEVALQATTYSVENGAGSGIVTSITTKSGANKFHGDGDYTYTGTPFAAVGPDQVYTPFRQQYASGALGGPIWKDRTFFFGSYFNQQVGTPNNGSIFFYAPEFIAFGLKVFPNSQTISKGLAPFPASRAVNIVTLKRGEDLDPKCGTTPTSVPCDLPIGDNGNFSVPQTNNGAQYSLRLDQVLRGGKDRANINFLRFDQSSQSLRIEPGYDGSTPSTGYYISGNYVHQITPKLVNEASFGQTRFFFNYTTTPHSTAQLDVPYTYGLIGSGGLLRTQFLETLTEHQSYGRDAVSWIVGKHNLTFGFQGAFNNELSDNSAGYGRPFFSVTYNFLSTAPGQPEGFAGGGLYRWINDQTDDEIIYTLSAQTGKFQPQAFGAQVIRFGAYAQDSWHITPNLLLSYGLRWDDFGNPSTYGKNAEPFSNLFLASGSTLTAQTAGAASRLVSNVYSSARTKNFLPRGAFAYSPAAFSQKLVIRGGIGLYEDDLNLAANSANLPTQPPSRLTLSADPFGGYPFLPITTFGNSLVQGPPGGNPYGFIFPTFSFNGFTPKGAPIQTNGKVLQTGAYGISRDLKPQSVIIFSGGIEQELPKRLIIGLLYSGSHGYNQLLQSDTNTFSGRNGAARPNTDFQAVSFYRNAGVANYNALIATARQTIGKLTYQASYTWGHSLADPTSQVTDQLDIRSQYTNSQSDIRNRFTLTQVYEVAAHFSSLLLNEIATGWSISNSLVTESGSPFTVFDGLSDQNQDGIKYDIPLYTGTKRTFSRADYRQSSISATSIFGSTPNSTLFVNPATATSPEGRQNTFFGPGYFTLDTGINKKLRLSLFKDQPATLELRGEAINILNRANYQNPSTLDLSGGAPFLVTSGFQGRRIQIGGRLQF